MIDPNISYLSSTERGSDLDAAIEQEPSHIHIARPSRLLSDTDDSGGEPADELRHAGGTQVTGQAA